MNAYALGILLRNRFDNSWRNFCSASRRSVSCLLLLLSLQQTDFRCEKDFVAFGITIRMAEQIRTSVLFDVRTNCVVLDRRKIALKTVGRTELFFLSSLAFSLIILT